MGERISISLATLLVLHGLIFDGLIIPKGYAEEAEDLNVLLLIQADPTEKEAAKGLAALEVLKSRLTKGGKKAISFPEDSSLKEKLSKELSRIEKEDRKPTDSIRINDISKILTEENTLDKKTLNELAAFLRLENTKSNLKEPLPDNEVLKQLTVLEAVTAASKGQGGQLEIPDVATQPLIKTFREANPGSELSDVEILKAMKEPKAFAETLTRLAPEALTDEAWLEVLGDVRNQTRRMLGASFAEDVRAEVGAAIASLQRRRAFQRAQDPVQSAPKQKSFFSDFGSPGSFAANTPRTKVPFDFEKNRQFASPRQFFNGGGRHNGGTGSGGGGAVRPNTGNPQSFSGNIQASDPSSGQSISIQGGVPSTAQFPFADRDDVLEQQEAGHVSLRMNTAYRNNTRQVSTCQITAVSKNEIGEQRCEYDLATARHCVENEQGETFTQLAIAPFNEIEVTRMKADGVGNGDMVMMSIEAECANVPIAPLAPLPPKSGEGITVYGRAPLVGVATNQVSGRSLMMMNVRDVANGGLGIYQGDSGGAVLNAKGQLVGVISSKLTDPRFEGIGFFATKDSLRFANEFVTPGFESKFLSQVDGIGGGVGNRTH